MKIGFNSGEAPVITGENAKRRKLEQQAAASEEEEMKIGFNSGEAPVTSGENVKRRNLEQQAAAASSEEEEVSSAFVNLNDDLLFEVLKHVDSRTLAAAACVSKKWKNTAHDERLWEMICTRHGANIGCGTVQLRSVVLALGGFRRLYALYLWPLLKCSSLTTSSSAAEISSPVVPTKSASRSGRRWGKDEVDLSLCLLSIRYYEKMNYNNRGRSD